MKTSDNIKQTLYILLQDDTKKMKIHACAAELDGRKVGMEVNNSFVRFSFLVSIFALMFVLNIIYIGNLEFHGIFSATKWE